MYIGRFAPSPTGPLHFGSLIAATASYLEAKSHQGRWLIRIEDLDPPREQTGATENILQTLAAFEFEWDGDIMLQSRRYALYEQALERLNALGLIYPCSCSRKEISDSAAHGIEGSIYPGTCRERNLKTGIPWAWRIRTGTEEIHFKDAIQGEQSQLLSRDIGDFVLKRADGQYAYQLAVVVDDAEQGITHVVRGADLINSTPRQIYLQQILGYPTPVYAHLPLATNVQGEKLSKQTLAKSLDHGNPTLSLWNALKFLGQRPPSELKGATLRNLWSWAIEHWNLSLIDPSLRIYVP